MSKRYVVIVQKKSCNITPFLYSKSLSLNFSMLPSCVRHLRYNNLRRQMVHRTSFWEDVVGELIVIQDFSSVFKVAQWFPCVVTNGVSFSLDEITVSFTPFLVICDSFYLVFFFSFDKVRRWFHEVRTMGFGFMMGWWE